MKTEFTISPIGLVFMDLLATRAGIYNNAKKQGVIIHDEYLDKLTIENVFARNGETMLLSDKEVGEA